MELYDSLSFSKINLENLLSNNTVNIYTCGPTVYDYIHIGNARPLILTDLLIRVLKYKKIKINFLLNVTDVDDKIINKAIQQNKSEKDISNFFYKAFLEDLEKLNLNKPNKILKVTENIDNFINYIDKLLSLDKAYINSGDVIFDITKAPLYGQLSKNDINNLKSNNKISDNKNNNLDFVLWKNTSTGIQWESPWSKGRPGWHLECAVFTDIYFGDKLDIHIGGSDLKFPHHENERAIFFAKNNKEISKIWLHNGLINIKNQKMSKSLNNSFYIKDFIKKYHPNVLKYIFYTKRFLQPLNINDELILFAQKEIKKISNLIIKFDEHYTQDRIIQNPENFKKNEDLFNKFINELYNNLNTANSLEFLKKIIKDLNISLKNQDINLELYNKLLLSLEILGLDFSYLKLKNSFLIKYTSQK